MPMQNQTRAKFVTHTEPDQKTPNKPTPQLPSPPQNTQLCRQKTKLYTAIPQYLLTCLLRLCLAKGLVLSVPSFQKQKSAPHFAGSGCWSRNVWSGAPAIQTQLPTSLHFFLSFFLVILFSMITNLILIHNSFGSCRRIKEAKSGL